MREPTGDQSPPRHRHHRRDRHLLGDGGRIEEQTHLFEPDSVVELHGRGEFVGREAIVGAYRSLNQAHVADAEITYIRHFCSNYTVEFQSPTSATGDGYGLLLNDRGLDRWGRCRDWYRRDIRGRWRFTRRLVRGYAGVGSAAPRDDLVVEPAKEVEEFLG